MYYNSATSSGGAIAIINSDTAYSNPSKLTITNCDNLSENKAGVSGGFLTSSSTIA